MALYLLVNSTGIQRDSLHFGVIENSFTSLIEMARVIGGVSSSATSWIPDRLFCGLVDSFPNLSRIRQLYVPTLFISGSKDSVVPPLMMRRLYDSCSTRAKKLQTFRESGHVDCWMARGYVDAWREFARSVDDGGAEIASVEDFVNNNNNNDERHEEKTRDNDTIQNV